MPVVVIYIAAGMLFIGVAPLPYGYYALLRIVATVVFAWAAYVAYERKEKNIPWVLGLVAIIFNPLIPIHLPIVVWKILDIVAGIGLLALKPRIQQK